MVPVCLGKPGNPGSSPGGDVTGSIERDKMNYRETKKMLKERDNMLRDAYYGRNGLSMSETQREKYRAMMHRAKVAQEVGKVLGV